MRYMNAILITILIIVMTGCHRASGDYSEISLVERLNKRQSLYEEGYKIKYERTSDSYPSIPRKIPRYNYSEDLPFHDKLLSYPAENKTYDGYYPNYDHDADNPPPSSLATTPQVDYDFEYPTYDPDEDNPYYSGQAYVPFANKVYEGYYPKYDPEADNPYYPSSGYSPEPPRGSGYKYPSYDPDADNPYQPPASDTQFDKPLFNKPLFRN
jgi:hypothetical protein